MALVHSGMLLPFIAALEDAGGDLAQVCDQVGLKLSALEDEFIAARTAWEFLEVASETLGDPCFGYGVGVTVPFPDLPNLEILKPEDVTLGERLTALVVDAKRLTNQANYTLSFDAETATLRQTRRFEPLRLPTQSDGFFSGFMIRIIRDCVGLHWTPERMKVRICSRKAVPPDVLPRSSLVVSRKSGMVFTFPADWMLIGDMGRHNRVHPDSKSAQINVVAALRRELRHHFDDQNVKISTIAHAFTLSERSLQSALKDEGTSFREELAQARRNEACRLLTETERPISDIGIEVGFPFSPSFTRAFRSWEGITPSEFRKRQIEGKDPLE